MAKRAERWSAHVMRTSNALDLEQGVFSKRAPRSAGAGARARRSARPCRCSTSTSTAQAAASPARSGRSSSARRTSCAHSTEGNLMPEKRTLERARRKARAGKSPSTVAGEFVREEMEDIRKGKHGARSAHQAIAIGLSKARRAGVPLAPKGKRTKKRVSSRRIHGRYVSRTRSPATERALKREPRSAASHRA